MPGTLRVQSCTMGAPCRPQRHRRWTLGDLRFVVKIDEVLYGSIEEAKRAETTDYYAYPVKDFDHELLDRAMTRETVRGHLIEARPQQRYGPWIKRDAVRSARLGRREHRTVRPFDQSPLERNAAALEVDVDPPQRQELTAACAPSLPREPGTDETAAE
jgi:hypothetical protein